MDSTPSKSSQLSFVEPATTKRCGRCKGIYPLSAFYHNRRERDGLAGSCKTCFATFYEGRQIAVLEKRCPRCGETKTAAHFAKDGKSRDGLYSHCRDCHSIIGKQRYEQDRAKSRQRSITRRYGLSSEAYDSLWDSQNGRCAICDKVLMVRLLSGRGVARDAPVIDHDHDTGRVRGILCNPCNTGIGGLQHDPAILARAIRYLEEPVQPVHTA